MHVIFVSNCEKKALPKTRRVLDRYATRIGALTWKTPITNEGLDEVHAALKRVATRQTSVACYRNKAMGDMDLIWVVGNRRAYDTYGAYASGTTEKKRPLAGYLYVASKLSTLSGYTHDVGKATVRFQKKLTDKEMTSKDKVRHEWISAWILRRMIEQKQSFSVKNLMDAWTDWKSGSGYDECVSRDNRWKPINDSIQSMDDALVFGVATHHRLFESKIVDKATKDNQCVHLRIDNHVDLNIVDPISYHLNESHMTDLKQWEKVMTKCQELRQELEKAPSATQYKDKGEQAQSYWRAIALISRAALVMADHEISSRTYGQSSPQKSKPILWANTRWDEGSDQRVLNQPLIWHLEQVGELAGKCVEMFNGDGLPVVSNVSIDAIKKPVEGEDLKAKYGWQDEVYNSIGEMNIDGPTLVFNIANLGTGKTKANVKILAALKKNDEGLRITAGFNLRSLTLQTSDAYVGNVGFDKSEVACVIGSTVSRKLYESMHSDEEDEDELNSPITHADNKADWLNQLPEWLKDLHNKGKDTDTHNKTLIGAPVLVTTMDHLVSAGEPGQQASHPHALLRISNSDLIIDEADSYSTGGLIAVCRVIEMAAMFGRNVVVSSATLPDYIAETIHNYWESGIRMYKALNAADSKEDHVLLASNLAGVKCYKQPSKFCEWYKGYAKEVVEKFKRKRVVGIKELPKPDQCGNKEGGASPKVTSSKNNQYVDAIIESAIELHNSWHMSYEKSKKMSDKKSKKISIGLVRVANVDHCIEITEKIASRSKDFDDIKILVTPYHAREVLARRSWKEKKLDALLKRTQGGQWWKNDDEAEKHVNAEDDRSNIIFIVVATPVEEVGRDHHFDWGIIEPSSTTSIIQTIGRIGRHFDPAEEEAEKVRIHVLDKNWRHFVDNENKVYVWPGYQIRIKEMTTHQGKTENGRVNLRAKYLLSPNPEKLSIPDNIMDMIFGDTPILFYREDKKSIQHSIKAAIQAADSNTAWMGTYLYNQYQLREGMASQSFYVNKGNEIKEAWEVRKNKSVVQHVNHATGKVDDAKINGTWLCPSMEDVRSFMAGLKKDKLKLGELEEIELWSFHLTIFKDNDPVEIHLNRLGAWKEKNGKN